MDPVAALRPLAPDAQLWGHRLRQDTPGSAAVLGKFLDARHGDVGAAAAMLHHTVAWRQSNGVDAWVRAEPPPGCARMDLALGQDRDGRPTLLTRFPPEMDLTAVFADTG